MKFRLHINYRTFIILALVLLPVLFFVGRGIVDAAQFCFYKNFRKEECHPNLRFGATPKTKSVLWTYIKNAEKPASKRWTERSFGSEQTNRYCTGKICVSRGLQSLFPRVQIVDRGADPSAENFPLTLRVRGQTRLYWYYPEQYRRSENVRQSRYESDYSNLLFKKCDCQKSFPLFPEDKSYPPDYLYRGGYLTSLPDAQGCGFFPRQDLHNINYLQTTDDPDDCYYKVVLQKRNDSEHRVERRDYYYRVKKIPVFTLEEITHNDKIAYHNYKTAVDNEASAKSQYERVSKRSVINPEVTRWFVFHRYDWGKEHIAQVGNSFPGNWPGINECPCSKQRRGCSVGSAIPWDVTSCYEKLQTTLKSEKELAEEAASNTEAEAGAKAFWDSTITTLSDASTNLLRADKDSNSEKTESRYYPYKVYEPGIDPDRNSFDFIFTYNRSLLPVARPALKVKQESQIQKMSNSATPGNCNIHGYFDEISTGRDHEGPYTDYVLTVRGNAKNKVDDIKKSAVARAIQAIAVETDVAISGAECRVTMNSAFMDSPFVYYYSTGDVEMPPVRILSFGVSVDGQSKSLGECSVHKPETCLPKEKLPPNLQDKEAFFTDGRTPLRSQRTAPAAETLEIVTMKNEVPATVTWNVIGAADVNGIAVARTQSKDDINDRDRDIRRSGQTGSYIFQGNDILRPGRCDRQGRNCQFNTYSFFLTATNDRAVTESDRLKYGNVQNVWSVAQKIDVKVKKEELSCEVKADEVKGKKNTAQVTWKVTGATRLTLEAAFSWGRFIKPFSVGGYGLREGGVQLKGIDTGDTVFTLTAENAEGQELPCSYKLGEPKAVDLAKVITEGWAIGDGIANTSVIDLVFGEGSCDGWGIGSFICKALTFNSAFTVGEGLLSTILKPFGGDLVRLFLSIAKPLVFGLGGVIFNLIDNFIVHKNYVKGFDMTEIMFVIGSTIPALFVGAADGIISEFLGPCLGRQAAGLITTAIDAVDGILKFFGVKTGCPEDRQNACKMGFGIGNTVGRSEVGPAIALGLADTIAGIFGIPSGGTNLAKGIAKTLKPIIENIPGIQKCPDTTYACINNSCQPVAALVGAFPTVEACRESGCGETKETVVYYECKDPNKRQCEVTTKQTLFKDTAGKLLCDKTCIPPTPEPSATKCPAATDVERCQCKKTVVGCGCPIRAQYFDDPKTYKTDAKRAVANAIMSAVYVVTSRPEAALLTPGGVCLPRSAAYDCAELLEEKAQGSFNVIFKVAKKYGGDLSQQTNKIDFSVFKTIDDAARAGVGCLAIITPNLRPCACEQSAEDCDAIPKKREGECLSQ